MADEMRWCCVLWVLFVIKIAFGGTVIIIGSLLLLVVFVGSLDLIVGSIKLKELYG